MSVKRAPVPPALARVWRDYLDAAQRAGLPIDHWSIERERDGSVSVVVDVPIPPAKGSLSRRERRTAVVRSRVGDGTASAIAALRSHARTLDAVNRVDALS